MLYDPNWQKPEVKADPFSLESLIAWLEKQPGEKTYCYMESGRCLLAQYLLTQGLGRVSVGPRYYRLLDRSIDSIRLPSGFEAIAIGDCKPASWTFGAALDRARAALASRVHDGR